MSGSEPEEESLDGSAVIARYLTFGEEDRRFAEVAEDYSKNYDEELASEVADSLRNYLVQFSADNERSVVFTREGNEIKGEYSNGASLSIFCFTPTVFDLQRWPSADECREKAKIVFDVADRLNADLMITLARRFIINGHLDD